MRRLLTRWRNQRGQTMIDLIVALALVSSAVASSGLIATTSARANTEAGRRSQAVALADREMEALRIYRNSQEKAGVNWNSMWPGLSNVNGCANFYLTRQNDKWVYTALGATASSVAYSAFNSGESDPNFGPGGEFTAFGRLDTICDASDMLTGTTGTFKVVVRVDWTEGNGPRSVIERTVLTDWNP